MKEKLSKTLIMNHHGDEKINKWTLDYILKKLKIDKNTSVYLENVAYSKSQEKPIEELEFVKELELCRNESDDHDAFFNLNKKLFDLKIFVKGLLNANLDYKSEEKISNNSSNLNSLINTVPKEHDEFMLDVIKKAEGPLIAVVGALHLIAWLLKKEISAEEYTIILPNHDKILEGLKSDEYNVQELYNQILKIEGIEVVNIDHGMSLIGEGN